MTGQSFLTWMDLWRETTCYRPLSCLGGFEMGKGTCVGCTIEGFENQNSEHKQDIAHYQNIVESMLFLSAF